MRENYNYFKIVLLLLFFICSNPVSAAKNFKVSFDKARIIPAKTSVDTNPVLYVNKEDTYLSAGKATKVKIDASGYFKRKRISFPTQIKVKITKRDPNTYNEIWLRTSTKLVKSLSHARQLSFNLDLGSFLSDYNEEFSFKLYDERGNFIQEYNQVFTAENFNPGFEVNQDKDFTACARDESMMECIYEAFGTIMLKQETSKTESYFARNADGSLVLSLPTIKSRKNRGKKKGRGGAKKQQGGSSSVLSDGSAKSINTRSTITSGSEHYHGYTEHLNRFTFLATSWDASHAYKNPASYGNYSAVFGRNNKTSNSSIIAGEDNFTTAYSAVFGRHNTGNSSYSLVAGQDNYVDSSYSLVSGKNNEVENSANSLVVGYYNDVNGEYASAIGHANRIEGQGSHILGSGIYVNGENSYAFGFGNALDPTIIQGDRKIAFVYGTETLLLIDGVNGNVHIGGNNGGGMTGVFNGTFVGDGSGLYNLNPNAFSGVVPPQKGGTGIANNGLVSWGESDINIMNDFDLTMRLQATTDITLPVSGVLVNRSSVETLTNKTINDSFFGPNISFVSNATAAGDLTFEDIINFNGAAIFNSTVKVSNCGDRDFLLGDANGLMQCTDFDAAVASAGFTPAGDEGSFQYKHNNALAGTNALKVTHNGNGLVATAIETSLIHFPGTTSRATGQVSFSNDVDFDNAINLDDSFIIPSCTTAGYVLTNDVAGKFSCVDPSTIFSGGGGNGTPAGADYTIQFNNNGSFAADSDFRFENGNLIVRNIVGVENLALNSATISGAANFSGVVRMLNELRIIDGNEGAGKVLVGDDNGTVSWIDPAALFNGGSGSSGNGGSLSAAGINGSIQFNEDGVLAADHARLQYTQDTLKAQAITSVSMEVVNASATATIDWSKGNQQQINLSQDTTSIIISRNPAGPTTIMFQLMHNSNTAVKTVNWPANFMFSDGSPPIMSTAGDAVDFVSCFFNPNNGSSGTYYCQASYNFF